MVNSLYIHIPFCIKKCHYCDFTSFPLKKEEKTKYLEYIKKELSLYKSYNYDTIYFGGGTPSIFDGIDYYDIIKPLFVNENPEITLEVNPQSVDKKKLRHYFDMGINRLSIGIQSFNDKFLTSLGRLHDSKKAKEIYGMAREVGFKNISIDLMFALPEETMEDLEKDLECVKKINPDHVSIYSLTYEEGTKFWDMKEMGILKPINNDQEADMYDLIIKKLNEYGYIHYEISNFAKSGYESRHNMAYWENKNYLGIGLAAAGYVNNIRYINSKDFRTYYDKIDKMEKPYDDVEMMNDRIKNEYKNILGLRLIQKGIKPQAYDDKVILEKLMVKKLVEKKEDHYVLTKRGIFIANDVFGEFLY